MPVSLKACAALLMVITIAIAPATETLLFTCAAVLLVMTALIARPDPRLFARRLLMTLPMLLGFALFAITRPNGWTLFCGLFMKSGLCLITMLLLIQTVSNTQLIGFFRGIGIPALLLTVITLMIRYLDLLIDEAHRMRRARASRTFSREAAVDSRSIGSLIARLFLRSLDRAERVYAAMRARGGGR
ncbi:MAG: hypothetical protein HQM09_01885 [Candidatus Riflebacteria bacterium]|nr:hypothetical protein [Candidatus Riflebacteria bacterium]